MSLQLFGRQAMSVAMLVEGERVLDIGCGWGDTSFEMARSVGLNGYVQGNDISGLILKKARRRIGIEQHTNINFECADAESHHFNSKVFDVVYSRFGVMFFKDPVAAFKNIRKVLMPDGRMIFICWQSIKSNQWVSLPLEITEKYVYVPQPDDPEAPGGFSFGDVNRVQYILDEAGFADIQIKPFITKFNLGHDLDIAISFLFHIGPASSVTGDPGIESATKKDISDDLRNSLLLYKTLQGVELDAATWIVTATKG